jgi:succinyl-CoA synthetase alpha subunit
MSILINKNTRVVAHGITGKADQFHTRTCKEYAGGAHCFVIGSDPVNGLKHREVLELLINDPKTDAVIMIGEIGGSDDQAAAQLCANQCRNKKPVVGFIARVTAPAGKRMGHAGDPS